MGRESLPDFLTVVDRGTCLLWRLSNLHGDLLLSQKYLSRLHPSFPCACPELKNANPDSVSGGAGQELPHLPYQPNSPAQSRPVS